MINTIFLVHHAHTDIGYTGTIDAVLRQHVRILDRVVHLCHHHRDNPEGERFKWTIETALVVEEYKRRRPANRYADLLSLMRDGLIELTGLYSQSFTELPGLQELAHLPGYAVQLGREQGFSVKCGMLNDIPGATWMLPEVLSQSGIHYYVSGANTIRTLTPWARDLPPLFRMQSPSGRGVLFWQFGLGNDEHPETTKSLHPQYAFGYFYILWPLRGWYDPTRRKYLYDVVTHEYIGSRLSDKSCLKMAQKGIASLVESVEKRGYPYDAVMLQAGADNFGPDERLCETVRRWNTEIGKPRVVIGTPSDFFATMENKYGNAIPVRRGELSDSWSDHVGSKAKETAEYRKATRALRATGALEGMAALMSPKNLPGTTDARSEALRLLMMCSEHTYGLNTFRFHEPLLDGQIDLFSPELKNAITSWRRKAKYALQASTLATKSHQKAMHGLVAAIESKSSQSIVVVNTGLLTRTGLVETKVPRHLSDYKVVDPATNESLPSEIVRRKDEHVILKFIAEHVPGCGYTTYALKKGKPNAKHRRRPTGDPYVVENLYYRLKLDPNTGCPGSIIDKELGLELLDSRVPWKMNQYIHEEIADFPRNISRAGLIPPKNRIHHTAVSETLRIKRNESAEGQLITVRSSISGPAPARLTQKIILCDYTKRIDFINRLRKEPATRKEAIYFAFPFLVQDFTARCEISGTVFEMGTNQLDGSISDFQAIQNSIALAGANVSVLWSTADAPLVSIGGMNALRWKGVESQPQYSHLFSYVMNNTWMTNCPLWQGGWFTFRYAFTSQGSEPKTEDISSFGREFTEPLQSVLTAGSMQSGKQSEGFERSLLSIPEGGVSLEAVETSNNGRRIRLMLAELKGKDGVRHLDFGSAPVKICSAHRIDLCGNVMSECRIASQSRVAVRVTPHELVFVEIETN